jgi:hypothetical protein
MLLTIVGSGLSIVLMSVVLQAIRDTRSEHGRASALMAARTGLTSVLGSLRAARDDDGTGRPDLLPCGIGADPARWPTQLAGDAGGASYEVTIVYLISDPTGQSLQWAQARGTPCPAAGANPRYAYLSSEGRAANGNQRTISATYSFKVAGRGNMPGGHLRIYRTAASVHDLCVDAGAAPRAGTVVTMQTCAVDSAGAAVPGQKFGYQSNLTINLSTADLSAYPNGLCLQAGWPQAVRQPLTLQVCGRPAVPQQRWSFNWASGFAGTTDDRTMNEFCWSVETADTPGSLIRLNDTSGGLGNAPCNQSYPNSFQSWNAAAEAGAGASGVATKQLVNFQVFGKCLDQARPVTDQKVFPCKQTPDPQVRDWNQVWFVPESGIGPLYHVMLDGTKRCLRLPPLANNPPTTSVVTCDPDTLVAPTDLTWRFRGADTPTYDEAYRIEGTGPWAGHCLQPLPGMLSGQQGVRVGIKPCSGDRLQKWNAEPPVHAGSLKDFRER